MEFLFYKKYIVKKKKLIILIFFKKVILRCVIFFFVNFRILGNINLILMYILGILFYFLMFIVD